MRIGGDARQRIPRGVEGGHDPLHPERASTDESSTVSSPSHFAQHAGLTPAEGSSPCFGTMQGPKGEELVDFRLGLHVWTPQIGSVPFKRAGERAPGLLTPKWVGCPREGVANPWPTLPQHCQSAHLPRSPDPMQFPPPHMLRTPRAQLARSMSGGAHVLFLTPSSSARTLRGSLLLAYPFQLSQLSPFDSVLLVVLRSERPEAFRCWAAPLWHFGKAQGGCAPKSFSGQHLHLAC